MKKIITPGELISEDLERKGWSQRDLARVIQKDFAVISRLVSGRMPVTANRAIVLSEALGRPAIEYMRAQSEVDLSKLPKDRTQSRGVRQRLRVIAAYDELAHAAYHHINHNGGILDLEMALHRLEQAGWKPKGEK